MVEMSKKKAGGWGGLNKGETGWDWVKIQIYHIPNAKEASKYWFLNNNDAPDITKHGFLVRPRAPKCPTFCTAQGTTPEYGPLPGPQAHHKALHTCTYWYAYALMFGGSKDS